MGLANSSDGYAGSSVTYKIKAYPPRGTSGLSQTKNVNPCQWDGEGNPTVQFDIGLEVVTPKHRIDITTENKNDSSLEKSLKQLRKKNIITEKEYQEKVLKLIN